MGDSVVYLFTSASGDKVVKAHQEALEQLFYVKGLSYEPVDAVDVANREARNALFAVSGLRAQYPQVFLRHALKVDLPSPAASAAAANA